MNLTFSPHVAMQVTDLDEAVEFYTETLGMELVERKDSEVVLRCGPMTFYIEESPQGATFFEFETDDLEQTRRELVDGGCRLTPVTTPEGDDSFLVSDPYGFRFHVFEP
jgi:catechol 2,3-dioxygenase-like lactoylglutathione lyase family enzyme